MPYMAGKTVSIASRVDDASGAGGTYILSRRTTRRARLERRAPGRGDQLEGFSLKKLVKKVSAPIRKVGSVVKKVATPVGHAIGRAATSKIGMGIAAGALALTGAGAPAAAAILAAQKGVGTLIKPGGNLGKAARGAAQGAVTGVAANVAGRIGRAGASKAFSILRREKRPAPAKPDALDTLVAKNKLPAVSVLPSSDASVPPVLRAIDRSKRARELFKQAKTVLPSAPATFTTLPASTPTLVEPAQEGPSRDDRRRRAEERRKIAREKMREERDAAALITPTALAPAEIQVAPSAVAAGGGGGSGGSEATDLATMAAQQSAESGGFLEFVKQNPIPTGAAAIALAGAVWALSRGGGRVRSA